MTRTRSGLQIGDDKEDKSAYPENENLSQRGTDLLAIPATVTSHGLSSTICCAKSSQAPKLKSLSFKKPCTVFISAVREVYQLHRQFYLSNTDALRKLIERVVDIVPGPVSQFLITKLY